MTNEELEQIKAANKLKTTTVTVAARVPQWLKGQVLYKADESGTTVGEYIALLLYADANDELLKNEEKGVEQEEYKELEEKYRQLREEYERLKEEDKSEKNLHKQAIEDIEKVERERDELKKKVDELKQRPTQKQYEQLQGHLEKRRQRPTESQYNKLQEQLDDKVQECEEWKNIAKKRQNIIQSKVQKMKEMQRYINYRANGLIFTPHQFVGGGTLKALEEDQVEMIEERGPENAEKDDA